MKTLDEKMENLAEKGNTDKLVKLALTSKKKDEQLAALRALRLLFEEDSIRCLMETLKRDDDADYRRAAAMSLTRVASKREIEQIRHFTEVETEPDIKKLLTEAGISAKDRTPRW